MAASSQGAAVVALRPPQPPLASGNGSDAGVAVEAGNPKTDVERFRHRVDEYISKADEVFNVSRSLMPFCLLLSIRCYLGKKEHFFCVFYDALLVYSWSRR